MQFLPFVLPQLLVAGILTPRDQMAGFLRALSDAFPLSYAVDGAKRAASSVWSTDLVIDLAVVAATIPLALGLGAATLRRWSP